jgi:peptidoglycan/LPS O-acetylase OafA/YrhL
MSPAVGRVLTAVGAAILALAPFLFWYEIVRPGGAIDQTTGWQTFFRLRWVILGGSVLVLAAALAPQRKPLVVGRALVGILVGLLVLRRIVFPPDIENLSVLLGPWVALAGVILILVGGLVDTGRAVTERYPDLAFWRPPAGVLGPGPARGERDADTTAEEV